MRMQTVAEVVNNERGFSVCGQVSFNSVLSLREQGEAWLRNTTQSTCVIDLSAMEEQDASVFTLLLCWWRLAKKKNIAICFISASTSLERMRKLFGLEELWISC
jgi:phospholipid transport system transporter-binding protein